MTLGNRGFTSSMHDFWTSYKLKNFNYYLTVVSSFTLHSTTNLLKANKAIPALFFMMISKPQELKPLLK